MAVAPTIRAVLVGVGKPYYWPPEKNLRNGPENDVNALAALLREEFGVEAKPVVGVTATKTGILTAVEQTLGESAPGDIAVFCFGGHALRADTSWIKKRTGGLVFLAFDTALLTAETKGNDVVLDTALSIKDLAEKMDKLPPGVRIEALFDTCDAGRAERGFARVIDKAEAVAARARELGLVPPVVRRAARPPTQAVISALRRLGIRNPWTVQYSIEDLLRQRAGDVELRKRRYVLWLSSSRDEDSHQTSDAENNRRGVFSLALESALKASQLPEPRRTIFRKVWKTLATAKQPQKPKLVHADERLKRRSIFDFGPTE